MPAVALTGCNAHDEWKNDAKSISVYRANGSSLDYYAAKSFAYDDNLSKPYNLAVLYKEGTNAILIKSVKKYLKSEYVGEDKYQWSETGEAVASTYKYANCEWVIEYN